MSLDPLELWKEFLESVPPNTPRKIEGLAKANVYIDGRWDIAYPKLRLHCDRDDGARWFETKATKLEMDGPSKFGFVTYMCRDCGFSTKTFALLAQRADAAYVEVMKLGEYPPFGAPVSARIQKLLGKEDLQLYRKGVRAEAQGLGIGAASYFRRIVENQWRLIVTEVRDAAMKLGVGDEVLFDRALKETQFKTAVDMLRDGIPQKLLILDGDNPLTLLYRPLSVQLHGLTDDECLQQAADIRVVLTALLENIADVLQEQNELRGAAARLKQLKPQQ